MSILKDGKVRPITSSLLHMHTQGTNSETVGCLESVEWNSGMQGQIGGYGPPFFVYLRRLIKWLTPTFLKKILLDPPKFLDMPLEWNTGMALYPET